MNEFNQCIENAANEVLRNLGNGHSESTYQNALELELRTHHEYIKNVYREITFPVLYKGVPVGYQRADFVVHLTSDEYIIIELKAVKNLSVSSVETQIQRYLSQFNIFRISYGIIINFPQNGDHIVNFHVI